MNAVPAPAVEARELEVLDCPFFGADARFHHIGVAVASIGAVSPRADVFAERTQNVSLAFVRVGGITLELLEPLGEDSPIASSLQNGRKLLHICYEVPDLEQAVAHCRPAGFHRISRPVPAPALDNRRIVWVFSEHYGLIELVEQPAPAGKPVSAGGV